MKKEIKTKSLNARATEREYNRIKELLEERNLKMRDLYILGLKSMENKEKEIDYKTKSKKEREMLFHYERMSNFIEWTLEKYLEESMDKNEVFESEVKQIIKGIQDIRKLRDKDE